MVDDATAAEAVHAYRMTLAYDGRAFFGWQRHPGKPTLQGALEDAVEEVFGVQRAVHASGRTDRGVHADAQVVHVHAPFEIPAQELRAELIRHLPSQIQLLDLSPVGASFHARDSAIAKTYRYEIYNAPQCPDDRVGRVWHVPGKLDLESMREALPVMRGSHDFTSFAKKANYKRKSMVRTLHEVDMQVDGPLISLRFRADGFLYKMVRNLVRALVKVGEGRYDAKRLARILAARDRQAAPGTAPASGLYLESVEYADQEAS